MNNQNYWAVLWLRQNALTCASISISISVVNTLTGFPLCQLTQPEERLQFQEITL